MSKYSEALVDPDDPNTSWAKLIPQVPPDASVLDVGCSSGYLGEALARVRGASVWGIEIDREDARQARERGLVEVLEGDVEQFDWSRFGDRRFEAIVFADVLEHLRDPEAALRQSLRALRPDGVVLASIPNIAHVSIRVELMAGGFVYEPVGILDDTHTRYFTRATAIDLFRRAGLTVGRVDATLYDLPEDLLLARLEPLGLRADDRFRRLLAEPEARAYQWVLTGRRGEGSTEVVALPEKLVMPHARLVREHQERGEQVRELEQHAAELERRAAEAQQGAVEAERRARAALDDLERILRSRRWRLASVLARGYRGLGLR